MKRLLGTIKRADNHRKTELWINANLYGSAAREVVAEMVLSLPAGHYRLHGGRDIGCNLIDAVYETYGWMPSLHIDEAMMLGLQVVHPDRVYASFTLGLDVVEIKKRRGR
ncbi:MAG: hypothetical protein WC455_29695 [Dehalococcoidia bacterium]|jgi:hypothetical protein